MTKIFDVYGRIIFRAITETTGKYTQESYAAVVGEI